MSPELYKNYTEFFFCVFVQKKTLLKTSLSNWESITTKMLFRCVIPKNMVFPP